MSNNVVLDRIAAQRSKNNVFVQIVPNTQQSSQNHFTPIEPDELKNLLGNLFQTEDKPKNVEISDIYIFPDLFHWVEWYLANKGKFTTSQQQPLDTLVQARDLINVGCACKRNQRFDAANNYFKTFWLNNLKNDLILTVLKILNVKSIQFADFLKFPMS